ncbi:MAG: nucleoside triphosphate pyrophosphohydrolase [Chloroflexi bacterium]|nr:nucleoside triphosphate pyrophosphohydrolase [Chloroflexota bacterium]
MITVVGLGPAGPELLTCQAAEVLANAPRVYLRTARHPAVAAIPASIPTESFDDLYERAETFEELYTTIVARLLERGAEGDLVYAVPGHPLVGEATVRQLQAAAAERGIPLRLIAGLSFVEPALMAVGVDALEAGLQVVDAYQPDLDPFRPALVGQLHSRRVAGLLKLALLEHYPPEHRVALIAHAGLPEVRVTWLPLATLDRRNDFDHLTCLYLPALPLLAGVGSERTFNEVVHRLRRECPWDRAQTHESLRQYLIEETFEAIDALESGDLVAYGHELGDVLLQVYLNAAIAEEHGHFTLRDVYRWITRKLIRRHPHVFGAVVADTPEQVEANWERIKASERGEHSSRLASVPRSLPALAQAVALQQRAERAGLPANDHETLWSEVERKLAELRAATGEEARFQAGGEVLWQLAQLANQLGFAAEDALRAAASRFRQRFAALEERARTSGRSLDQCSAVEISRWWQETARAE